MEKYFSMENYGQFQEFYVTICDGRVYTSEYCSKIYKGCCVAVVLIICFAQAFQLFTNVRFPHSTVNMLSFSPLLDK